MDYIVKNGTPSKKELQHLAVEIGDSWKSLGRHLGFIEAELTAFDNENVKYSEKSYQMLLRWQQRNGPDALYGVLHVALCDSLVSHKDLATKFCCEKVTGVQSGEHVSSPSGTASLQQYAVTGVQSSEHVSSLSGTASQPQYAVTGVQSGEHASSPSGKASQPQYADPSSQPLTGSPWSAPHKYKTESIFGLCGEGQERSHGAVGIAVSERTGNIAVADFANGIIQIFSSERKFLREFGQKGPGAEILGFLVSVAFTRSGDIIVVHDEKIFVFTETGQFIKRVINKHLKDSSCVSVGRDGHLIVCDRSDTKIQVLSPDGTELLHSFSAPDCDKLPGHTVYHQDKFFVSYHMAHCVKVFNKEGVFLYNIGSEGSGDGQLKFPWGVAIDKFNNLIVCDDNNDRLQMFTLDGQFVSKTGQHTARLESPNSVAVTQDGHVLVTNGSNCVHVLK